MNWIDRVLADQSLTSAAKRLADVIAKDLGASNVRYTTFYDTEPARILETNATAISIARGELERRGYLVRLHYSHGRPAYTLRGGFGVANEEDVA